ncbi:recombination initiation protein NBS1 [Trypanosoma rangeli]|uniref:Recombination initiation protein NBS1 n=1 Tax=Trypanosoma rangeli TaxID=5698 RepID=A0A3S5IQF9_TRYRA|nr:recombination initiation protein NBS1 [Trypanosoma rangeli]RNE99932.1 recombination initiation protein NBS1 [Trypanosoma rangeli]|eukprot:RNE99932.1 recombination initiation protein NBS1 [Trypanosoma rangeli]
MRVLELKYGADDVRRHVLLAGERYTIGRKECRLPLPSGDPSVSRHHAIITVRAMPPHSVLSPNLEVDVSVTDCSKHGTLVNKELIGRDNSRVIYSEDVVMFGRRVTARVRSTTLILVASIELSEEEQILLQRAAVRLGATILQEPVSAREAFFHVGLGCIGFLYVTHDGYEVTPDMLLAITHQYHVTTPSYVSSLVDRIAEDGALMPLQFPAPTVACPASASFPVEEYLPPSPAFYDLNEFLLAKPQPRRPLQGYTFTIADAQVRDRYETLLHHAGAVVMFMPPEGVTNTRLYTHGTTTVGLASDDMFARLKATLGIQHCSTGNDAGVTGTTESPLATEGSSPHNCHDGRSRGSTTVNRGCDFTQKSDTIEVAYATLCSAGLCVIPEINVLRAVFTGNVLEITGTPSADCLRSVGQVCGVVAPARREEAEVSMGFVWNDCTYDDPCCAASRTQSLCAAATHMQVGGSGSYSMSQPSTEAQCSEMPKRTPMKDEQQRVCSNASTEKQGDEGFPSAAGVDCECEEALRGRRSGGERRSEGEQQQHTLVRLCQSHTSDTHATPVTQSRELNSQKAGSAARETHALPRKPIIVYAPAQMNGSNQGSKFPARQRVVGYKITSPRLPSRSTSSAVLMSSRSTSHTLSKDADSVPREEALEKPKGHSHATDAVNAAAVLVASRQGHAAPQPVPRYCVAVSQQNRECTGGRARSTSHSQLLCTPHAVPVRQLHSTPKSSAQPLQRERSCPSTTMRRGSTVRRPSLTGADVPRFVRSGTGRPRFGSAAFPAPQHHCGVVYQKLLFQQEGQQERTASCNTNSSAFTDLDAAAEMAQQQQDAFLGGRAVGFMHHFLDAFSLNVEQVCQRVLKQRHVDAKTMSFLEDGVVQLTDFIGWLLSSYRSDAARESTHDVHKKALVTLRRILATCKAVRSRPLLGSRENMDAVRRRPHTAWRPSLSRELSVPSMGKTFLCVS